ncbi:hypothetical protein ABEB36_004755 [Hypothenemus hampei]|uniref:CCHC-type domain-containing protein n=1 Tax=Hypothenemus hampei TaxID=57062 RepID=A0ABD1EYT4_HYPHA
MTNTVQIDNTDNEEQTKKNIYIIKSDEKECKINELYDDLENIKNEVMEMKMKGIIVYDLTEYPEMNRKVMEYRFRTGSNNITINIKADRKKKTGQGGTDTQNREWSRVVRRRRHQETMVVKKGEGDTYEDTVRNMAKKINNRNMNITVKSATKTKEGDVKIRVTAKDKNKSIQDEDYHNKDLEADIKEEDIKQAIKDSVAKEVEGEEESIDREMNIRLIKPAGKVGHCFATLREELVDKLVKNKRIVILWNRCRITELFQPVRCFKCLGYGHYASDCQNPNRANELKGKCFKCTEEGHSAKTCPNQSRCYECEAQGHRCGHDELRNTGKWLRPYVQHATDD